MRSPFPYLGGKSLVADDVWQRFGDAPNYVEPFFGSGAVLLARPQVGRRETVNDLNAFIANFWRAVQADSRAVEAACDRPISETELFSMHKLLLHESDGLARRCMESPDYYDAQVAGYWVYGQALWFGGSSWTSAERPLRVDDNGVVLVDKLAANPCGIHAERRAGELRQYLLLLRDRIRDVRVRCGDWKRTLKPTLTTKFGTTAVFLDPPYSHALRSRCYAEDHDISADVRAWALEHGDDPRFRIALCGYEDEHGPHMPDTWECLAWKAASGYARTDRAIENRTKERVWFSPHCIYRQRSLF